MLLAQDGEVALSFHFQWGEPPIVLRSHGGQVANLMIEADDVNETMKDYTEAGTYDFTMDRTEVVGEVASIVWHAVNQGDVSGHCPRIAVAQ
jgi:hypothetical protein